MFNFIVKTLNYFAKLLFPRLCFNCGKYSDDFLCYDCFKKINFNKSLFCSKCLRRLPDIEHRHSNFPVLATAGSYDDPIIRNLIFSLKYQKFKKAAIPLASIIAYYINNINLIPYLKQNQFAIVSIPLYYKREKMRGFNQSELIGKELSKKLCLPFERAILKRIKNTKPQVELKEKEQREKNVENCFQINNTTDKIPKNILLLDDVFTTGATMREAVKTLKQKGCKKVICLVAAKA